MKKIIQSIGRIFKALMPKTKQAVHTAIVLTEGFKKLQDSGATDLITQLIPGTADDMLNAKAKTALPKILISLRLVDATIGLTKPEDIIIEASKILNSLTGNAKKHFVDAISVELALVAADGKLTWNEGKHLVKWYFDNEYKLKN